MRLNQSTISFFNLPETAASRWSRVKLNASKVSLFLSLSNFVFVCVCVYVFVYTDACLYGYYMGWKSTRFLFELNSKVNCFLGAGG